MGFTSISPISIIAIIVLTACYRRAPLHCRVINCRPGCGIVTYYKSGAANTFLLPKTAKNAKKTPINRQKSPKKRQSAVRNQQLSKKGVRQGKGAPQ
jgi:hypothetical protein